MSLRQVQKQLDKQKKDQDQSEDAQELEKELLKEKKKPTFSAFQMISDSDEEQEEVDQQKEETQVQSSDQQQKKKKKKNRGGKKKKVGKEDESQQKQETKPQQQKKVQQQKPKKDQDDDEFLNQLINKVQEESKGTFSAHESVLKMDKKHFSYKKELKLLFAKSAQAYGALGLDEEEKEERKNRGHEGEDHEGMSKKMRRRLKMVERVQEKNRVIQSKKYVLVQPDPEWPRVEKILTMEQVRTDKNTGQKIFSYVKSPEYIRLQKEFENVQRTNDIGQLMDFLRKNFYHHESLLYFADFLRIQGKFSDSFHFLERCLFAFEQAWTFEYQPVPPEKQANDQYFVPQTRMDLDKEHLNKVFCECIVKYIDILGRKGCSRTSYEYCKFLLSICPYIDPYGSLLRIDFYALRAHEYQMFIDFVRKLPLELYPEESSASLLIMPNILLSLAFSKTQVNGGDSYKTSNLDQSVEALLTLETNLNKMIDFNAESFIIAAMLLYPGQIEALIRKVAQKQINMVNKKSHFEGYQTKTWTEILQHELFAKIGDDIAGEHGYSWILSNDEKAKLPQEKQDEISTETLSKLYQIYVTRSSSLFAPEYILLWLKEVIGYVLNKLDDGSLDRDLIIAKFTSLIQSPIALSRYRHLKTSDFTDDITTVNPQELLMGGGGVGPVNEFQDPNVQNQQAGIAAQQLQQMINQLNQPMPRGPRGQFIQQHHQQQMNQQLIQQREFDGMNEQELVAMQEALLAQMQDNEDIYVDEDEYEQDHHGAADEGAGGGIMNFFNNLLWGAGGNQQQNNNNDQQNQNNQEEEKKRE